MTDEIYSLTIFLEDLQKKENVKSKQLINRFDDKVQKNLIRHAGSPSLLGIFIGTINSISNEKGKELVRHIYLKEHANKINEGIEEDWGLFLGVLEKVDPVKAEEFINLLDFIKVSKFLVERKDILNTTFLYSAINKIYKENVDDFWNLLGAKQIAEMIIEENKVEFEHRLKVIGSLLKIFFKHFPEKGHEIWKALDLRLFAEQLIAYIPTDQITIDKRVSGGGDVTIPLGNHINEFLKIVEEGGKDKKNELLETFAQEYALRVSRRTKRYFDTLKNEDKSH